jgi:Fe2+ or Zn2+ uptake regulation protein
MYKDILRKNGYKLTKQRLLILDLFSKNHKPINAKQIYTKLNKKIDLASVYRIINLFKSLGIVFEERINHKEFFYLSQKQHHHIICRKCGYSECLPCRHLFENIKNFSDISHKLTISGICKKCS